VAFEEEICLEESKDEVHDDNQNVERSIASQCHVTLKYLSNLEAIVHHAACTKACKSQSIQFIDTSNSAYFRIILNSGMLKIWGENIIIEFCKTI